MGTKEKALSYLRELVTRYPRLKDSIEDIEKGFDALSEAFFSGKTLFIAGNGGSFADAEHMAGELLKSFKKKRIISNEFGTMLKSIDEEKGEYLQKVLEGGLPVIPLSTTGAFSSAYINDVCADALYAQQLMSLGKKDDIFLGISTSGNSANVVYAAMVAKAKGMKVVGLTGINESNLSMVADITIKVPETDAYRVQELHLPIYHCLCLMLEERFFG